MTQQEKPRTHEPSPAFAAAQAELARAIEAEAECRRRCEAQNSALERMRSLVSGASAEHRSASARLAAAREAQAKRISEAALIGGPASEHRSMAQARSQEAEASDRLEAAQAALAERQCALSQAEEEMRKAVEVTRRAADGVIRSLPVAEALERAIQVQADLIARRVALRYLLHSELVAEAEVPAVRSFLREIEVLPGTYGCTRFADWDAHPVSAGWRSVREALVLDPDTPLPAF